LPPSYARNRGRRD